MSIINPENYFYASNGAVLKDLNETLTELRNMSQEHFSHHVNSEKNDFSNWIRDIINDDKLAKKLSSTLEKQEMISILESTLSPKAKKKPKKSKRDVISSIKQRISHGE